MKGLSIERRSKLPAMAIRVFLALSLLALLACADKSNNADNVVGGWRSAGLILPDAENTGGVHELAAVGDVLFALDCYTTPGDSNGIRHREWRLWSSKVGGEQWGQVQIPDTTAFPYGIYALGKYLYVSTWTSKTNGKGVWRYEPEQDKWTHIVRTGLEPAPLDSIPYLIGYLGSYKGKLAMSILDSDTTVCVTTDLDGTNAKYMPCPGKSKNIGSMEIRELNGALYGISEPYGVFRYTEGAASWDSLPSARGRKETMTVDICQDAAGLLGVNTSVGCSQEKPSGEIENVASVTVHDGHLIVGYKDNYDNDQGIYRLESNDTWTSLTPLYMHADTLPISDAMQTTEALLSYKGWLIAGGASLSFPRFWVPLDSATPQFGDWRIVYDNWTDIAGDYFAGVKTTDLLGVGDTLYAAAWTTVVKIPLSEISSLWKYQFKPEIYPHLQDSLSKVKAAP